MKFAIAFLGAPILAYLVLASLPRGRPALIGILAASALATVLWVTQLANENTYPVAIITLTFSAIALAGFVQILRSAVGDGRPRWVYAFIVVLALVVAGLAMLYEFGH